MAFPAGLTNGQTTTINGVAYVFSASDNSWTRVSTPFGDLAINGNLSANNATFTGNVYANANVVAGNVYVTTLNWANGTPISFAGTYSNVIVESYIGANIGAYQLYANANIAEIQANIGAFYNYANTKIGDNSNGNLVVNSTEESYSTATGALVVKGGAGIQGNLWISGNIYSANLISIGTTTLSVQDPLLYLTASSLSPYNYDIGFFSQFIGGSSDIYQHTGFARDASTATWGLFSNVQSEPGVTINWYDTGLIWDTLKVGAVNIANITVSTSSTTGALVIAGGAGIGGNAYVGGNVVVTSNVSANRFYTAEGLYWSGNGVAFSSGGGGSGNIDYIASATAPVSPDDGDFWYQTTTGILFQYLSDGTTSYWFDMQTESVSGVAYTDANVETYIGANIGSYQTYANANAATQATSLNTINANVGAYQTYANANAATQATSINSVNAAINNIISPFLLAGM